MHSCLELIQGMFEHLWECLIMFDAARCQVQFFRFLLKYVSVHRSVIHSIQVITLPTKVTKPNVAVFFVTCYFHSYFIGMFWKPFSQFSLSTPFTVQLQSDTNGHASWIPPQKWPKKYKYKRQYKRQHDDTFLSTDIDIAPEAAYFGKAFRIAFSTEESMHVLSLEH